MTNALVTNGHYTMAQDLNKQELEIVKASYSTKIAKIDDDTMYTMVLQTINRSYVELGQTIPGEDKDERKKYMDQFTKLVLADIRRYFSHISPEEIAIAVSRGIRNEYGKYFGFNVVSINFFVTEYLKSADRIHALKKQKLYLENLEKQNEPPTVDQEYLILAQGCLDAHQLLHKTNKILDFNSVKFNFLYNLGLILFTNEEYEAFKTQATADLKREIFKQKSSPVSSIRDLGKSLSQSESFDLDVKNRVNLMLLSDFFYNITIDDLLETLNDNEIKQQFITIKTNNNERN